MCEPDLVVGRKTMGIAAIAAAAVVAVVTNPEDYQRSHSLADSQLGSRNRSWNHIRQLQKAAYHCYHLRQSSH